jgi:hypothetical protein
MLCATCRNPHAEATWTASRGEESWPVCDSCQAQGTRLNRRISYVEAQRPLVTTSIATPTPNLIDTPTPYVGHNHPPTAHLMQTKALPRSGTLRRAMAEALLAASDGLTDDDLEVALDRSHQSASACRNTLMRDGLVQNSGRTRVNRHGNPAIVWEPTDALRAAVTL